MSAIETLPVLPIIFATDMLHAQAFEPTPEQRRDIVAVSDFLKAHGGTGVVRLAVLDIFDVDARIGHLDFTPRD
jgi:hypothetical protein